MAIYKFIKLPRQRSSTFDFARPSSTFTHKGSEASGLVWPSLFLLLVKSKNKDIYKERGSGMGATAMRPLERLQQRYPNAVKLTDAKSINDWNLGQIEILLAHPASAGHGLNLQAGGNAIVWFSLPWSLELYEQANARLHRQGQTQAVIVHHLLTEQTIDEDVLAALTDKAATQGALMDALKARIHKLEKETI